MLHIPFPCSPMERDLKEKQELKQALEELEEFKCAITKICDKYIKMIDMKIASQDKKLNDACNNMEDVATDVLNSALEDGRIVLTATYNPDTESLVIGGNING